jgi:hypothetical protein
LGVNVRWIQTLIKHKRLKTVQYDIRAKLIDPDSLREFEKNRKGPGAPKRKGLPSRSAQQP